MVLGLEDTVDGGKDDIPEDECKLCVKDKFQTRRSSRRSLTIVVRMPFSEWKLRGRDEVSTFSRHRKLHLPFPALANILLQRQLLHAQLGPVRCPPNALLPDSRLIQAFSLHQTILRLGEQGVENTTVGLGHIEGGLDPVDATLE